MKTIRYGVFETNSSSVHSLVICTKEEYDKFKNGEMWIDRYSDIFVQPPENPDGDENEDDDEIVSYKDYGRDFNFFDKEYTTPNGDVIVAFGYYGDDC